MSARVPAQPFVTDCHRDLFVPLNTGGEIPGVNVGQGQCPAVLEISARGKPRIPRIWEGNAGEVAQGITQGCGSSHLSFAKP